MVTLPCGNILYSAETVVVIFIIIIIIVIISSIIIIIIIIILWSHVGGCDVLIIIVVCGGWKNCICKQITNALTARDHIIRSLNCCGPGVACTITEKVVTTSYSTKIIQFQTKFQDDYHSNNNYTTFVSAGQHTSP